MDARLHGAEIRTQCPAKRITIENGQWTIETPQGNFTAKMIINATGPYVRSLLEENHLTKSDTPKLKLVQGSHIIIPKLYDGDNAYLIQCPDRRVVFVFPYERDYTLVGTTETLLSGSPASAKITPEEKNYLLSVVNREFDKQTVESDIVWDYCGVRPLFDNGAESDTRKVTRDYKLVLDNWDGASILNIFGGKITTYRPLAEEVMEMVQPYFPNMGGSWTGSATLPLIDFDFAPDNKSIRHFIRNEWAKTADDVLWRRTKWGLHMSADERENFKAQFDKILDEEMKNDQNSSH
jgi:glycerol-3-phosphate dehydrogenase